MAVRRILVLLFLMPKHDSQRAKSGPSVYTTIRYLLQNFMLSANGSTDTCVGDLETAASSRPAQTTLSRDLRTTGLVTSDRLVES